MKNFPLWPVKLECSAAVSVKLYESKVLKSGFLQADRLPSGSGADF